MTEAGADQYLVTGVSGFQGGAVARFLAQRGDRVRGMCRNGKGAEQVPPGVSVMAADLGQAEDVHRAFEGVTHASVVFPLEFDTATMLGYARNVADAALGAGVRRLVFNTSTPIPAEVTPYAAFETKRAAEDLLRESGVPLVVLRPRIYLDNLFSPWNGPAIAGAGVVAYPVAADRRVSWLSHDDLAALTAAALTGDGLDGAVLEVGGPLPVTGAELAAEFATALDKQAGYQPLRPADFENGLAQAIGPVAAAGVAGIYHWVDTAAGQHLLEADAAVARGLGVELTPLAQWISSRPWEYWTAPD